VRSLFVIPPQPFTFAWFETSLTHEQIDGKLGKVDRNRKALYAGHLRQADAYGARPAAVGRNEMCFFVRKAGTYDVQSDYNALMLVSGNAPHMSGVVGVRVRDKMPVFSAQI